MTDRPAAVGLDIHQASGLIGAYCAIERRLFEFTGRDVHRGGAAPEIQLHLDAVSAQHAWHAELWADRLPVTAAIEAGSLVALPPALEGVIGVLSGLGPLERLAGLFRVLLPRLVVSYSRHAVQATPATDAPTARALSLVVRDETDEWVAGESLVERVLGAPEAAQTASRTVVDLETRLIAAGIVPGLVPWPGRRA